MQQLLFLIGKEMFMNNTLAALIISMQSLFHQGMEEAKHIAYRTQKIAHLYVLKTQKFCHKSFKCCKRLLSGKDMIVLEKIKGPGNTLYKLRITKQ